MVPRRTIRQPKYLLCEGIQPVLYLPFSLSFSFLFIYLFLIWMGSELRCSQHWSYYLGGLSDFVVCKQAAETSALEITSESKRTGFVVLKFNSFKVKNKDKEVCFDSIKGLCWFICSLWFGQNARSCVVRARSNLCREYFGYLLLIRNTGIDGWLSGMIYGK